jgi:PPPDE putative peptidase domain
VGTYIATLLDGSAVFDACDTNAPVHIATAIQWPADVVQCRSDAIHACRSMVSGILELLSVGSSTSLVKGFSSATRAIHRSARRYRPYAWGEFPLVSGLPDAVTLSWWYYVRGAFVTVLQCCRHTEVPHDMINDFLQDVSHRFNATTYDLLRNNCNNFSNELCEFLVSKRIPVRIPECRLVRH